jgi:hypothetical protein
MMRAVRVLPLFAHKLDSLPRRYSVRRNARHNPDGQPTRSRRVLFVVRCDAVGHFARSRRATNSSSDDAHAAEPASGPLRRVCREEKEAH